MLLQGSAVLINIHSIHLSKDIWSDPDKSGEISKLKARYDHKLRQNIAIQAWYQPSLDSCLLEDFSN